MVGAILGGLSLASGALQYFKGKNLEKRNKRFTAETPSEAYQNLSMAQQMALQGLPEEQKQQFISNLQRGTALGLRELGTRKAGISGISALNQQQNDGYQQMLGMDSQARVQNQNQLMQQNQNIANYKDRNFQLNTVNPYYERVAQSQAMMGAGLQNINKGIQLGANFMTSYGQPSNGSPYFQRPNLNSQTRMLNFDPNSLENNPANGMYNNTQNPFRNINGTIG